ncbi:MAG: small basic family protein [Armatimonadota bacterium]
MILIPIAFFAIGVFIAMSMGVHGHGLGVKYLAVACLAGLDTILGGIRSGYEGKFQNDVFITGFITNTIIAFGIAKLGDKIGIELLVVVNLVMGMRIFNNLSVIRRYLLQAYIDMMSRRKRRVQEAAALKESVQTSALNTVEGVE